MPTLTKNAETQRGTKRRQLHVVVREGAYLRLKHAAAKNSVPVGELLSQLIEQHVPAVEVAA